tara:strand:- start:11 stop:655 length:645 start_codon:yes stop_codon:yes gene_type:complete
MIIYLYVKTHNKTGLKYLGQTTHTDPCKYKGSGTYWKLHIKKHGYDVTTEILKECNNLEEISHWGLYYSNLWDIVDDDKWANLKEEAGDRRGRLSAHSKEKISKAGLGRIPWNKGKRYLQPVRFNFKHSEKTKQLLSELQKGKSSWNKGKSMPDDTKQKIKIAREKQIITDETKRKISEANKGKKKPKATCPHCGKSGGLPQMIQWHFDNCKNM